MNAIRCALGVVMFAALAFVAASFVAHVNAGRVLAAAHAGPVAVVPYWHPGGTYGGRGGEATGPACPAFNGVSPQPERPARAVIRTSTQPQGDHHVRALLS
jgi:hypothetical protein